MGVFSPQQLFPNWWQVREIQGLINSFCVSDMYGASVSGDGGGMGELGSIVFPEMSPVSVAHILECYKC